MLNAGSWIEALECVKKCSFYAAGVYRVRRFGFYAVGRLGHPLSQSYGGSGRPPLQLSAVQTRMTPTQQRVHSVTRGLLRR
jgi:hypothetical protein